MNPAALLLERLGALIQQSLRDDAARHGLLPIQLQVLHYLARANRYSDMPIAVAEFFGVTRGTVSQTIGVLERKGLLVKSRDPKLGRRIRLELTARAERIVADSWTGRVEGALEESASAGTTIEVVLRDVLIALQRLNGQSAFGICHECAHFLREANGARCGLTRERLAEKQTFRICREWSAGVPADRVAASGRE